VKHPKREIITRNPTRNDTFKVKLSYIRQDSRGREDGVTMWEIFFRVQQNAKCKTMITLMVLRSDDW